MIICYHIAATVAAVEELVPAAIVVAVAIAVAVVVIVVYCSRYITLL